MTERVDISNIALSLLGEEPITSLEDESARALQMKIHYIPSRDATTEAHEWSFAIERFIPPMNAVAPIYGAANAFDVPAHILRVISVDREYVSSSAFTLPINSREQIDWQFERGQVICNEEVIYCRGIRRVEQEGRFSPLFVLAFAAQLASQSALAITASADIQANMFGLFDKYIGDAKARDGLQGRNRVARNRQLIKAR